MALATPPVTDPAAAIAVARCILARTQAGIGKLQTAVDSGHPRPCEWCPYPVDILVQYAKAFREYAFDHDGNITDAASAAFHQLPRREQRRLRYLAQYGEEPAGKDGSVQTGMAASAAEAGGPRPTTERPAGGPEADQAGPGPRVGGQGPNPVQPGASGGDTRPVQST